MKHDKVELFPHGMSEDEAKLLMTSEDVYDILETFDTLNDALDFIKDNYGFEAYEYAKKDAEESVNDEKEMIKYSHDNGNLNYMAYTSFSISDNIENYRKGIMYEPSFFWFPSGRIVRVEMF